MNIKNGKKVYDNIEIPKELNMITKKAIEKAGKNNVKRIAFKAVRWTAAAAVLCLIVMGIGVNVSYTFADKVADIPLIGRVAQVLTVRSWEENSEDFNIDIKVPNIITFEQSQFAGDINKQINALVDDYVAVAQDEFEEYKNTFFATGGTEEEWAGRRMDINVDYNVKYQKGCVLSLELITSKAWTHASQEVYYYNVNLETMENITLKDILGEDYINIANTSIKQKIEENLRNDSNLTYWGFGNDEGTIDGFKTVGEGTKFYINGNGNPVIVFDKYEIAPGFMGIQEFEVKRP